jgi:pimeloyl-ACP methyl ester carboxylesterase
MSNTRLNSKKSTTVRSYDARPPGARWLLQHCPRLGALLVAELAMAPRTRLAAIESRPGDTQTELRVGKRRLRVHAFGEGPLVVLVHGWQGAGSQMRSLAEAIVAAGFRVAIFDMPAHGEAPGWSTSGPEFTRILRGVATQLGPLHAVVGHSLGGTAALSCAAAGLPLAGVVAIAPIPSFEFTLRGHVRAFGLSPFAKELLARRLEARTHTQRDELDLANLDLPVPALLIHDLLDRTIPSRHSRRLKDTWRRARLIETCGFGHRRVLEAELVAQAIVAFLVTLPGGGAPDPVAARCVPAIEAKTPRSGSSPVKLPC